MPFERGFTQAEGLRDQPEGLRRLLLRASLRVVTVVGAARALGATSVVVNLAAALARAGKQGAGGWMKTSA